MKRILFFLFFLPSCAFTQSQRYITEINNHVWIPFVHSFNTRDDSTYKAIHSKELIRVNRDNRSISGLEQYLPQISEEERKTWANWVPQIELRFIERIVSEDKAFETGYFKSSFVNKQTGEARNGYGKFIVLLRKENGLWKILMDADGNEGTDEERFQRAAPMDSIRRFAGNWQIEKNEIVQLQAVFSDNYLRGDFLAMSNAYSDSAILMSPAQDIIIGRSAIYNYWNSLPKTKLLFHKSIPEKIVLKGSEAYEYGYYFSQSQKPDGTVNALFSAKYFIIWAKEHGQWKMKMDMWNSRCQHCNKEK